jgi:hypothetical protein
VSWEQVATKLAAKHYPTGPVNRGRRDCACGWHYDVPGSGRQWDAWMAGTLYGEIVAGLRQTAQEDACFKLLLNDFPGTIDGLADVLTALR